MSTASIHFEQQSPPAELRERGRRSYLVAARRFLVIAAIAFWLGGFTFYSGVAIPMGVEVLGGHRTVGFITERVTQWLNLAGVIALAILLWDMLAGRRLQGKALRRVLLITWALMLAVQVELIVMHPILDRMLAPASREILDEDRFDSLHRVYLWSASGQWFAGVVHVAAIAVAWAPLSQRKSSASI